MVERALRKRTVEGSIPSVGSAGMRASPFEIREPAIGLYTRRILALPISDLDKCIRI